MVLQRKKTCPFSSHRPGGAFCPPPRNGVFPQFLAGDIVGRGGETKGGEKKGRNKKKKKKRKKKGRGKKNGGGRATCFSGGGPARWWWMTGGEPPAAFFQIFSAGDRGLQGFRGRPGHPGWSAAARPRGGGKTVFQIKRGGAGSKTGPLPPRGGRGGAGFFFRCFGGRGARFWLRPGPRGEFGGGAPGGARGWGDGNDTPGCPPGPGRATTARSGGPRFRLYGHKWGLMRFFFPLTPGIGTKGETGGWGPEQQLRNPPGYFRAGIGGRFGFPLGGNYQAGQKKLARDQGQAELSTTGEDRHKRQLQG